MLFRSRTARPLRSEELEDRFRLDLPLVEKAILIGEAEGLPVGMVRFDRSSSQHEVSIILAASWRGRGAAKPLLETAMDAFQAIVGPAALSAEVASENIASAALFRGCGFQLRGQVGRFLQFSLPTPP